MRIITEEMKLQDDWYNEAREIKTVDDLAKFVTKLGTKYGHDYGTVCHAVAASAIAAAWCMNAMPHGGITGFQAGCVMWEFIRRWNYSSNKTGMRIIDYDNFLYPQYEYKYQKTIAPSTWKAIQKAAANEIEEADKKYAEYLTDLKRYEKDIKAFVKKYPDYYERREHYDRLGIGTGEQWQAYEAKRDSGFEFAPDEPYEPVGKNSPAYKHWKSIVSGKIPFGYHLSND